MHNVGAMTSIPAQVEDRIIFYRHYDANFYGAFAYAFGKAISLLPQVRIWDFVSFILLCFFSYFQSFIVFVRRAHLCYNLLFHGGLDSSSLQLLYFHCDSLCLLFCYESAACRFHRFHE